ncbi:MAG: hypothetical protein HWE30_15455 [Methylocystaceae bacterium]|nr:hypothetical protein [Methylocystaceae bacterium]
MIERALGYPYEMSATSYILENGRINAWSDIDLSNRTPVLACGSNQSPEQLMRKFSEGLIPVMAGWLEGYDSVYSAHFTSYGSVAATYHYDANVKSRQMITWLDDDQLEMMHKTEALGVNYEFVAFEGIEFQSDCAQSIGAAYSYQSLRGPLMIEGQPIGLQAIQAVGASYRRYDQKDLQALIQYLLGHAGTLADFITETINHAEERHRRTKYLSTNHIWTYPCDPIKG